MKKIISLCLVAVMLLSVMIVGVAADEPTVSVWNGTDVSTSLSGTGTEADPWLIQSAADLKYFADTVNANHNSTGGKTYAGEYVKVTVDIDLGGHKWTPIGHREKTVFLGTFDGDGHTISGLSNFENPDGTATVAAGDGISYRNGFFGGVGTIKSHNANQTAAATTDTTIKNFTLTGKMTYTATGHAVAGGAPFVSAALIGHVNQDNYTGTTKVYITNVTVDVDITVAGGFGSGAIMGNVVGIANGAVFTNVVNNGDLTVNADKSAYNPTGAFAGRAENVTFVNCVNNGNVSFKTEKNDNQTRVGGFVGQMYKKQLDQTLTFENCVNNGNVTAESTNGSANIVCAGGFLGNVYYNCGSSTHTWTDGTTAWRDYKVTFKNCANTGDVTTKVPDAVENKTSTGGFVGTTYEGSKGASNNGGGFTLTGCANTGTINGKDEGRSADFIGAIYTDKAANYNIVVKNCVGSGALTGFVALKDWKEVFKGSEGDNAKAAQKRVNAIVKGNANTGDNTTLVVAMVAVLALGTAFVVSKKVTVRAR